MPIPGYRAEEKGVSLAEQTRGFVARARARKAEQLAFMAWAAEIPSEQVAEFTETQWQMLAAACRINMPSKETCGLAWNRLVRLEAKGAGLA
jgi:hypothetical protein